MTNETFLHPQYVQFQLIFHKNPKFHSKAKQRLPRSFRCRHTRAPSRHRDMVY